MVEADSDYDAEDLYETTSLADLIQWLEDCETNAEVPVSRGGTAFSEWEREFLASIREQFDLRVERGSRKPLTGKQLVVLKRMWDKI